MLVSFKNEYLSIKSLNSVEFEPLSVITGVNGSGKSHLLKAIELGHLAVDELDPDEICYFNYETFRLENEGAHAFTQVSQTMDQAWQEFNAKAGMLRSSVQSNASTSTLTPIIKEVSERTGRPYWFLKEDDFNSKEDFQSLQQLKNQIYAQEQNLLRQNKDRSRINHADGIISTIRNSFKLPHEIDEEEFRKSFTSYKLKNNLLPIRLGSVFLEYYNRLEENSYRDFRNSKYGETNIVYSEDEFENIYGPKPWNVVNDILEEFEAVPYRVNSPEGLSREDRYQLQLVHTDDELIRPNFDQLSSGERILLSLIACVYKTDTDKRFPKLLLLDEIDASLHPSMIKNLFAVVKNTLQKNDVQVILVTHSATTVALAPEDSVYLLEKEGGDRLKKTTKSDAMAVLTEGFATLEEGLKFVSQSGQEKLMIASEGRNIHFLREAIQHAGIKGVGFINGMEDMTSDTQLVTIFELFANIEHRGKVAVVWDPDQAHKKAGKLTAKNDTIPFVLKDNSGNTVCEKRGIECKFPDELFEGFCTKTKQTDDSMTVRFHSKHKHDFETRVVQRKDPKDFQYFNDFISMVENALEAN